METDSITKSVLKKSDGLVLNKNKKVTFCDTVKVFVDNPGSTSKTADVELQVKCVEITIVDNSNDHLLPPLESSNDDCSVSDFLVHKVVYDSYSVPDDDIDPDVLNDDVEEEPVLFEVQDDDDLEFIVHKVTDHEDDLIKQEIDFHVVNDNDDDDIVQLPEINTYDVMHKFSKLSVENILEHDKIIAFIDQKNFPPQFENETALNIPEIDSYLIKKEVSDPTSSNLSKSKEELILSPPLQELSLEKIVKAHSDNVLCELDISPLNSIQETDSESDLSSEGTMIMMTSEECQKNEQHIQESLLLYRSLKEKPKTEVAVQNINSGNQITDNKMEGKGDKCTFEVQENVVNEVDSHNDTDQFVANINFDTSKVTDPETNIKRNEEGDSIETVSDAGIKNDSTQFVSVSYQQKHFQNASDNPGIGGSEQNVVKCLDVLKKESLSGSNTSSYWDKSLASIEIPNDVREWKILLNSFDKNQKVTFLEKDSIMQSKIESNANSSLKQPSLSSHRHSSHITSISKVDELENFVQESRERVERIRKRYLLSGKAQMKLGLRRHSPIRGIRPRFGSTAEILHLMQKQNQAPFLSISGLRNHMSWPCNETISNPEVNRHNSSCIYVSQTLPGVYAHNSFSQYCDEQFNSTSSDHYSISSCPSIMIHERGVPEGASPPRSLSEDCNEHLLLDNPNNVVYYSMKV